MKKIISLILSIILSAMLFAGCTPNPTPNPPDDENGQQSNDLENKDDDGKTAETGIKTGFAVISTAANSQNASTETEGFAQVDSVAAAVLLDIDGKIIKCIIDTAQTNVKFNASGIITTPLDTVFETKNELGSEYNMKVASKIGREWDEQLKSFSNYVEGKTLAEVKGISVNEAGYPTDEDLTSSVTVSIGGYIDVIEKAVLNSSVIGSSDDNKLGLGIVTNIENSVDSGEKDGNIQVYSTYCVITTDNENKITSSILDASQTNISFDSSGKITTDLSAQLESKNELGDNYGMKKASSIGKEWNEQAKSFSDYVIGKTAVEVASISVNEDTHPTKEDLTSSVTITVGDFITAIAKASAFTK